MVERWLRGENRRNWEKTLLEVRFIHHETYLKWLGIEPEPLKWEFGIWSLELCHIVVAATDSDPATASQILQTTLLAIQSWLRDWRINANETKSVHVTFTTRRDTCPPVHINDVQIPQENHVKYLGLHLDRRLSWHTHIFSKRKQLVLSLTKM
jgi:hypothetical protein